MEREDGEQRASDTFAVLASEHRMGIIKILWERRSTAPNEPTAPVPFSELFEATGLDDKGKFNYHLRKLVGPFLARTDQGYTLTYAGQNIARAVQAGSMTDNPSVEDEPVHGRACPYCDEEGIVVSYDDGIILFSCTNCEGMAPENPLAPPGAIQAGSIPASAIIGRDLAELYDSAILWGNHVYTTLLDGFCPACAGAIDERLVLCDEHEASDGSCDVCGERFASRVRYECQVCGTVEWGTLWGRLAYSEPVFGFLYEHGANPRHPTVEDLALSRDIVEEVCSTEPPSVEYEFAMDGETVRVRVDESLGTTTLDATNR